MRRKLRDFVHFPVEGLDLSRIMAVDKTESSTPMKGKTKSEDIKKVGKKKSEATVNGETQNELSADNKKTDSSQADENKEEGKDVVDTAVLDEDEDDPSRLNKDDGRSEMLYDLYGVVHHQGALSGGHYVASLKSEIDGQWRLFNDAQIYEIHSRDVVDSSAYILFYIRRDVQDLKLDDFWSTTPAKEGEGITEEEMEKLIRGRSDRCVIS